MRNSNLLAMTRTWDWNREPTKRQGSSAAADPSQAIAEPRSLANRGPGGNEAGRKDACPPEGRDRQAATRSSGDRWDGKRDERKKKGRRCTPMNADRGRRREDQLPNSLPYMRLSAFIRGHFRSVAVSRRLTWSSSAGGPCCAAAGRRAWPACSSGPSWPWRCTRRSRRTRCGLRSTAYEGRPSSRGRGRS